MFQISSSATLIRKHFGERKDSFDVSTKSIYCSLARVWHEHSLSLSLKALIATEQLFQIFSKKGKKKFMIVN